MNPAEELTLYTISVTRGETVDLQVNLTSDHTGKNNAFWLNLYQDDVLVAQSIDDSNGGDDNTSVGLLYKAKNSGNDEMVFKVKAKGGNQASR